MTTAARLAAMLVAFLCCWLVYGNFPALVAGALVMCSYRFWSQPLSANSLLLEEILLLTMIGFVLLTWSELGRARSISIYWLFAAIGLLCVFACLWFDVRDDSPARTPAARLRQTIIPFGVAGSLLGSYLAMRREGGYRRAAWLCSVIVLFLPVTSFVLTNLFVEVSPRHLWNNGPWESGAAYEQLAERFEQTQGTFDAGTWSWGPAWLVIALCALGIWRAYSRGLRQRRANEMPIAWVALLCLPLALIALSIPELPAAPVLLVWAASVLPVIGVFDVFVIIGEGMKLKNPVLEA